jgi:hypothetical protein
MADEKRVDDLLSVFSIRRIRDVLRPTVEEVIDELLRGGDRGVLSNSLIDVLLVRVREDFTQNMICEVHVQFRRYIESREFETYVQRVVTKFAGGKRSMEGNPAHPELPSSPTGVSNRGKTSNSTQQYTGPSFDDPGDRKRAALPSENIRSRDRIRKAGLFSPAVPLDPSKNPVDADVEMAATSLFARVRAQYESYMKTAQTKSDCHVIRCQAYSVIRAKCRRSSEIKLRARSLVLEFMQSDANVDSNISVDELGEIQAAIYDSVSKYKFSLTI